MFHLGAAGRGSSSIHGDRGGGRHSTGARRAPRQRHSYLRQALKPSSSRHTAAAASPALETRSQTSKDLVTPAQLPVGTATIDNFPASEQPTARKPDDFRSTASAAAAQQHASRVRRYRRQLHRAAKTSAGRVRFNDAIAKLAPASSRLTEQALDKLNAETAEATSSPLSGAQLQHRARSDWQHRPMQHRRASSESCITLEEVAERSRQSKHHVRRRSSLTTQDAYNNHLLFAQPVSLPYVDPDRPSTATTFPLEAGATVKPSLGMRDQNNSDSDDPLPQLSLLSATQTAPVGWRRPNAGFPPASSSSAFQPEQQRFWPLVDSHLDYTGARMLSAAISAADRSTSACKSAVPERHAPGSEVNIKLAPQHDGVPRDAGGARTTLPPISADPHIHRVAAASTSNAEQTATHSPHTPGRSLFEARRSSRAEQVAPSATTVSFKGANLTRQPMSPSSTLAHIVALTRRQADARLRQSTLGRPTEIERSSSSESEGDCTPRQWRFNAIVARGREASASTSTSTSASAAAAATAAAAAAATKRKHDDLVASSESDVDERLRATAAMPAAQRLPKGWSMPTDYFGDWDTASQRRRLV